MTTNRKQTLILVLLVALALLVVAQPIADLARYIAFCAGEGDPANDWLTHLPKPMQPMAYAIGTWVAEVCH